MGVPAQSFALVPALNIIFKSNRAMHYSDKHEACSQQAGYEGEANGCAMCTAVVLAVACLALQQCQGYQHLEQKRRHGRHGVQRLGQLIVEAIVGILVLHLCFFHKPDAAAAMKNTEQDGDHGQRPDGLLEIHFVENEHARNDRLNNGTSVDEQLRASI